LGLVSEEASKAAVLADLESYWGSAAKQPIEYLTWTGKISLGPEVHSPVTWFQELGRVTARYGENLSAVFFWAGTEVSTRWPGYFDGAIRAGKDTFEAALKILCP
jgi:monoamine oxidase